MSVAKIYNSGTGQWEPAVLGAQGPTGPTGPTGPQGPTGPTDLPITTQGDLIIGDNLGVASRLAVGASGSLLYSDGTTGSWLANSGVEGDILQVSSTGGLEFVTPSGGGGMTLISTTTLSGATTTITGIPNTFKALIAIGELITLDVAAQVYLQPVVSGTALKFRGVGIRNAGALGPQNDFRTYDNINASNNRNSFYLRVDNYTASSNALSKPAEMIFAFFGGDYYVVHQGGAVSDIFAPGGFGSVTGAIDGLSVIASGANFTGGTVKLYGVN